MSGANVIGIAQTGTGKTFAYLLPILRMLTYSSQRHPRVLILAPTHELTIQILEEVQKLTKYTSIRSLAVFGGGNINKQKQSVYDGCDVVVATPGRLMDLVMDGMLSLKSIQKLVIDEVDEMLSLGFKPQIVSILEKIPEKRQNLMFSATLSPDIQNLIDTFFPVVQLIEVAPHGTPLDQIIQQAYHVPNFNTKVNLLSNLLTRNDELAKVLIFVGTKKLADRLFETMELKLPGIFAVIHSNKAHNTRLNALDKFESGEIRALIATDVMARGMDIQEVTHVINFDLPQQSSDYIHRIGRTGRADRRGVAISFINEMEREFQHHIETLMDKTIPMFPIPESVEISMIFGADEKPEFKGNVNYLKAPTSKGGLAFHSKSAKNSKVNLGGPGKQMRDAKKSKGKKSHRRG
jgi:ATP-dependent RNA helicase RhlE